MKTSAPSVIGMMAMTTLLVGGCSVVEAATSPLSGPLSSPSGGTVNTAPVPAGPGVHAAAARNEWTGGPDGTALFSVGDQARDGLKAAIPAGRYLVRLAPGAQDGSWMVCDSNPCGPTHPENATTVGHPIGTAESAIYIGPRSSTLWLGNVILSPAKA